MRGVVPSMLLWAAGCGDGKWPLGTPGSDSADTGAASAEAGPLGFIGAPCETDDDCLYDGGMCLTDELGFPEGSCSLPCEQYCPDDDDAPVTYCVSSDELPDATAALMDAGACASRCDFSIFPRTGCREGYGCAETERPSGSDHNFACLPERDSDLTACHQAMVSMGLAFEPAIRPVESPDGYPELTCEIADAVWLLGTAGPVQLHDVDGFPTPRVLTSCEAALALAETGIDVASHGVSAIRHWGSYSCRTITGTATLSQHGYADAFDITGFELSDGSVVTLLDHWEHDTQQPSTSAGVLLFDASQRWYEQRLWNVILTPNYNLAHDDHFHVDLTPGSHYLGVTDGRYWGPAPYVD